MMLGPVLNMVNGPVVGEAHQGPDQPHRQAGRQPRRTTPRWSRRCTSPSCAGRRRRRRWTRRLKAFRDGAARTTTQLVAEYTQARSGAGGLREDAADARQASGRSSSRPSPAWTTLEVEEREVEGRRHADQAARRLGPGERARTRSPESLHRHGHDEADGHHGHPPGGAARPSLPAQGPGRAPNGNFVLNEFKVTVASRRTTRKAAKPVVLHNGRGRLLAGELGPWPAPSTATRRPAGRWPRSSASAHTAVFEMKEPLGFPAGTELTFTLDQKFPGKDHNLGKFRLSVTTAADAGRQPDRPAGRARPASWPWSRRSGRRSRRRS